MNEQVGVVIVGGGITGVTVGRLLQRAGFEDFVILEKASEAGGLCRSREVEGHILDVAGGHMLCSKYPEVLEFIFDHLPPSEFNSFERVSKISLHDDVIDYPIEYNLWQLPVDQQVNYLIDCVRAGETKGDRPPENFEEWVRWKLGNAIADNYMIPYNRKIWGVEPNELATDWLDKIPRHDVHRIMQSCLERQGDRRVFPSHQSFMYPKRGGFQTIFDAIHESVKSHVRLSTPLTSLRRTGRDWVVNDRYRTEMVVNTIPWSLLHSVTSGGPPIDDELARMQTSALVVTLHEERYTHDRHWTYVPAPEKAHHREFYIHNFAPHSAPNGFFRETNARYFRGGSSALAVHHNEHAYPIPVKGHSEAAKLVWSAYAELAVIGVGRWGQHRYYNSDVCIREAMRLTPEYLAGGVGAATSAMASARSGALT